MEPEYVKEKIKEANRIENVIGEFLELDQNHKAICPFHEEKTPSFSVNVHDQYFHCFGCDTGGDVIAFIMKYNNMTFNEALKYLSERAGIDFQPEQVNSAQEEQQRSIESALAESANLYHRNLNDEVKEYLFSRGLSEETISKFKIGYCDGRSDHKAEKELLIKAGLLNQNGSEYFKSFITFPHFYNGRITYLSGRGFPEKKHKKLNKDNVQLHHLYNEQAVREKEVILAEGEIDTLTLLQNGFNACGALGASSFPDNWKKKFDYCDSVYISFDADEAGEKGNLRIAQLIGEKARIVQLPAGKDINDFLKSNTAQDYQKLLNEALSLIEYKIKQIPSDTPKTRLPEILNPILKELSNRNEISANVILNNFIKCHFKFNKSEITGYEKALKKYRKETQNDNTPNQIMDQEEIIEILKKDDDSKSIHPAQDFQNAIMNFAIIIKHQPYIITSAKKVFPLLKAREHGVSLKTNSVDQSGFSHQGIRDFIENDPDPQIAQIYKKIFDYINRFIVFPDESYLCLLVLWIIGTYFFMVFRYYPYIWLNAEKSSGKTLLMEVISAISFNGELITNPTEAVIFRDISNNLITMFIDEVEQLRKRDKDVYGSLISLLNTGFNKSGNVKRTEPTGRGNFIVKRYSSYSPKMFAGINEIDDVLQDRTIRIPLLRKKDSERVERYKETHEITNLQKQIRDSLYIFTLKHADEIAQLYHQENTNGIEGMDHLSNRELDIWEPIFLIANIIDAQSGSDITGMMQELSKRSQSEKQSQNVSENETYKLLSVIKPMLIELTPLSNNNGQYVYESEKVLDHFRKTEEFEWVDKSQKLTRKLKKVNIVSDQLRVGSERKRIYIIDSKKIYDLCERFKI